MSMGKYEQDFWICDESFVDKTAAVQDKVVVFQIEYQKDGRKRATNVRAFSNVSDEDNKLASNYLVYHEMVELKDHKVNMLNRCEVPRNYLLAKLKDIIEMQETRSVESTVKILSDFIGKYNTTCPTTNRRYIFSQDFDTDLKEYWIELLSLLTTPEWLAFIDKFTPAVIYADEEIINTWLDQLTPQIGDSSAFDEYSYTLSLLSDNFASKYSAKWAKAAEDEFIQTLENFKIKGEVRSGYYGRNELDDARNKLRKYSDKDFEEEIQQCLCEIKITKFRNALTNYIKPQRAYYQEEALIKCFSEIEPDDVIISEINSAFAPLIKKSIESKELGTTFHFLKLLNQLKSDLPSENLPGLKNEVTESLLSLIDSIIDNESTYKFKNEFESKFGSFTSLYDEDFINELKSMLSNRIKESKSFKILLNAADSDYSWLSEAEALSLAISSIGEWDYSTISNEVHNEDAAEDIDSRISPHIFKRAIEIISPYQLDEPFDGTDLQKFVDAHNTLPTTKNIYFLKRILKLHRDEALNSHWQCYLDFLNSSSLISLYDNEIIKTIPESLVVEIIKGISLTDTYSESERWYSAPSFKDERIKKVLSNSQVDIFTPIAEILKNAKVEEDTIPLYVWLVELLSINKPENPDYYSERNWNSNFSAKLATLRASLSEDSLIIPILWSVYMETRSSQKLLADMFPMLPPYLQIKIVKKFFSFVAQGKMKHTAKCMYEFLTQSPKRPCLAVEILFSYLIMREDNPNASFNNTHMLKLIDGRKDHSEWIGIREFVEQCHGRWSAEEDDSSRRWRNEFYNGLITDVRNSSDICIFLPNRMIDESQSFQNYNNKYFNKLKELIDLNFSQSDYTMKPSADGIYYYFKKECEKDILLLTRHFNIHRPYSQRYLFSCNENLDDYFCECRMSNELSRSEGLPFFWCSNEPCFRPSVRFHANDEWQRYTVLDFLRILNIPIDYTNRAGRTTKNGYFIIFSGALKSFAKFYEHLKCRKCREILHPVDITNFAKQSITEFKCTNESCEMREQSIYLNNCFNKQKCGAIIDSRDSAKCPNSQYICPDCGACCSTETFRQRISNLHATGGYVSTRLITFVNNNMGHWERIEFFCHVCGTKMGADMKCPSCGATYNNSKSAKRESSSNPDELPF